MFGSSCYWAWVLLDRSGIVPYGSSGFLIDQQVLTGVMALMGLIIFLSAGLMYRERARQILVAVVTLLAVFGVLGLYYADGNQGVSMAASLALCCVRASLMQLWSMWLLSLPGERAVVASLVTTLLSAVLFLVVVALPLGAALIIFSCFPICAAAFAGFQRLDGTELMRKSESAKEGSSFNEFLFWRFLIGLAIGLLGMLGTTAPIALNFWHRALSLLCAVGLAVLTIAFWKRDFSRRAALAMPIALAFFFIFPFGIDESSLPKIAFVLCWLYSGYISLVHILGYAPRTSLPFLKLVLLSQAVSAVGTFVGSCFGVIHDWASGLFTIPASVYSSFVLLIMLTMLAISLILLQRSALVGESENDSATEDVSSCLYDDIEARYELTSRERDVLELLSKGYSRPYISNELCLSESTVKTHVGNLYRKLNVHKHDELLNFIAECQRRK